MPVNSRYDENIIVIDMADEYSIEDLRSVIFTAVTNPDRPKNSVLMIDLTNAQSIYHRPSDIVNAMGKFVGTLGQYFNNRIAIVAPDRLKYGLMRMSSSSAESLGISVEIFQEYSKARDWLLITRS